jgi:hypothetical protein
MNQARKSVTIGISVLCSALCAEIATAQIQSAHRVQVILSAQEAAVRTSVANLDIYAIRIQRKTGAELDAIALDQYPHYDQELPAGLLTKGLPLSVRLSRTPYCDRVDDNHEGEIKTLPCFTVVHGSWKTSRHISAEDMWWK